MAGRKRRKSYYSSKRKSTGTGKSASGTKRISSKNHKNAQESVHDERMKELSESGVAVYAKSTRTERMLNRVKRKHTAENNG